MGIKLATNTNKGRDEMKAYYAARNADGDYVGAKTSTMVPRFAVVSAPGSFEWNGATHSTKGGVVNWCGTSILAQRALDRAKGNKFINGPYLVPVFEVGKPSFNKIKSILK